MIILPGPYRTYYRCNLYRNFLQITQTNLSIPRRTQSNITVFSGVFLSFIEAQTNIVLQYFALCMRFVLTADATSPYAAIIL